MRPTRNHVFVILIICSFYFWLKSKRRNWSAVDRRSKTCGRYPQESDILFDNINWQVLDTPAGMIKLLNAYMDRRFNETVVKINSNGPKVYAHTLNIFCQFWMSDTSVPYIVRSMEIQSLWTKRENFKL